LEGAPSWVDACNGYWQRRENVSENKHELSKGKLHGTSCRTDIFPFMKSLAVSVHGSEFPNDFVTTVGVSAPLNFQIYDGAFNLHLKRKGYGQPIPFSTVYL
jgi:hypothetical protein